MRAKLRPAGGSRTPDAFCVHSGLQFTAFSCACIFIAVQVMFEYRETEIRQGIQRRC